MANIAYLILAHEHPKHLGKLIDRLTSTAAVFFIHLDKKSPAAAFRHIRGENIHFTSKRKTVHWGDFSIVEATLLLLRAALAHPSRPQRFVLLSGADYPLHSAAYIEAFFERHGDTEYMGLTPMPSDEEDKPISRLTTYKARPGAAKINWLVRRALVRFGAIPKERDYRAHLKGITPYGGSMWWALSREACEYMLEFIDRERRMVRFFKHTHCPDESFFHTILGNSAYKNHMLREVTYADWTAGGRSPALFSEAHLERFREARGFSTSGGADAVPALFARKFSDESTEIAERLRQLIESGAPQIDG